MSNFLEITGSEFVTGKDEKGSDLALTKVSYKKYSKDEAGSTSPDGQDEGIAYFVGSISGQALTDAVSALNLPEAEITTFIGEGAVIA